MNRRNVLLGLGTAAAGSGIVFGSGAFTQVQAERSVTIGIANDSNALLGFEANDNIDSVNIDDGSGGTGELVIDTRKISQNSEGFNVGSRVLIGETENDLVNREPTEATVDQDLGGSTGTGAAFKLTNNFGESGESDTLDIGVNLEDLDSGDGELTFIGTRTDSSVTPQTEFVKDGSQVVFNGVDEGEEIYFAIELETDSTTSPDDFDGEVTFRAGPDLDDGSEFPADAEEPGEVVNVTQNVAVETGSIQDAIDGIDNYAGAKAGDLIQVHSGTFDETVTIDVEGLTLEGPNAGLAGDSNQRGAEASVGGFVAVDAEQVTIDGFAIEREASGSLNQKGVIQMGAVGDSASGSTIANNVITPNDTDSGNAGLGGVAIESADNVTIIDNVISPADGSAATIGITRYVSNIENLTVSGNTIETDIGMAFGGTDAADKRLTYSASITNNVFDTGDTVSQTGVDYGLAVYESENLDVTVEENDFIAGNGYFVISFDREDFPPSLEAPDGGGEKLDTASVVNSNTFTTTGEVASVPDGNSTYIVDSDILQE